MTDILTTVLVLGCLMGVFAVIFRGALPKHRGPGVGGVLTRLTSPSDAPVATAALSSLALATALSRSDPVTDVGSAVSIGLLVGILIAIPGIQRLTIAACGMVIGNLLALAGAVQFIYGSGQFDPSSSLFRASLMGLLGASFWLAVVVFDRRSVLRGERGLALFGLVELVTFFAAPTNRDIFGLPEVHAVAYIVVACVLAFTAGFFVSEFMLGLIGVALAATVWFGDAVFGDIPAGDPQAAWLGFVSALVASAVVWAGSRLFGARTHR